jgi:hypothetical protein
MSFLDRLIRERGGDLNPLEKQVQQVGKDLTEFSETKAVEFVKLTRKAIRSAGLSRSATGYVFWVLTEHRKSWPLMDGRRQEALGQAVDLMERADATPNLAIGYELPDNRDEDKVENVILAAAAWAEGPLRGLMLQKYMQILEARTAETAKVLGVPPAKARVQLEATFLTALKRHPRWFSQPDLLSWALRPFL